MADEFVLRNVLRIDRPLARQLQAATMSLRMLRQAK
jgi:hypothetical protein